MNVGEESYIKDRLGNTLAVVRGFDHLWIDVLFAGDDGSDKNNWHQVATLLPAQVRGLMALLCIGVDALEKTHEP